MSASDSLGEQLRMFMTAREIKDYLNDSGDLEDYNTDSMDVLWDKKLEESKDPNARWGGGVYDALASGKDIITRNTRPKYEEPGVVEIMVGSGPEIDVEGNIIGDREGIRYIADMHHRIAAQADIDEKSGTEKYLPVTYIDEGGLYERS